MIQVQNCCCLCCYLAVSTERMLEWRASVNGNTVIKTFYEQTLLKIVYDPSTHAIKCMLCDSCVVVFFSYFLHGPDGVCRFNVENSDKVMLIIRT